MDKKTFVKSCAYENLMEAVSGTGRYQNFLVIISLLPSIVVAFMHTGSVFIAGLPPSRCFIEVVDNNPGGLQSQDFISKTFIPYNDVTHGYDRCKRYNYNLTSCGSNLTEQCVTNVTMSQDPLTTSCQDGFYFDRSTFLETVTTQWDLVCDNLILMTISSSIYYVGLFCGALIGGMLSDRYGRVRVCQGSSLLSLTCGLALAFSPNIYVFVLMRFLLAFCLMPSTIAIFVYSSEISKKFLRPVLGSVYNVTFGLGCVLMSFMAYRWRHWKELEIAFSLCVIPTILIVFFLFPKSPRWLLSNGKSKDAYRVCQLMARRNKGKLSEKLFEEARSNATSKQTKASIMEILRRPYLRFTLIANCIVWSVTSLVYYGLALNSGALSGSVYLNHALGGVMELTACLASIPMLMFLGRKNTTVSTLAVSSGSCLLSTICIQLAHGNKVAQTAGIVLAMIGRFSSSATFAAVYQHTVELFPTPGRGTALGVSSMAARFGSIITPFTLQLQYELPWLTQTIFGIVATLAAILASCFPETNHRPLLSTFTESENFLMSHLQNSWIARLFCLPQKGHLTNEKEIALMEVRHGMTVH